MAGGETDAAGSGDGGSCVDGADTAWVLVSFVLVLVMYPGLALFEAGLLRAKNTLSIMMQVFGGVTTLSVLWDVIGYSLVYGPTFHGLIGGVRHALLFEVAYDTCSPFAPTIPTAAFAMFQMLFAAITPLLMTGAFAERLRFWPALLFFVLWEVCVYYPVAHWVWGGGWLKHLGVLDFAGGIVVHTTAGSSSLVCALVLGRREFYAEHAGGDFPPSNLPLALTGAGLLFCGWFGFNAGSALASGSLATSAVVSTQIGGCVSGMVWLLLSAKHSSSSGPSLVALLNGTIAGLAGITPASGFVDNQGSLALGFLIGLCTYYGCRVLRWLQIDDSLEVSVVHGLSGVIGSVAIGVFATPDANPQLASAKHGRGLLYGGDASLLGIQCMGVAVVALHSVVATAAILKVLGCPGITGQQGLRISAADEHLGLDIVEHGETAYHELMVELLPPTVAAAMPNHFGEQQTKARRRSAGYVLVDDRTHEDLASIGMAPSSPRLSSPSPDACLDGLLLLGGHGLATSAAPARPDQPRRGLIN